jgi:hypothetical protein
MLAITAIAFFDENKTSEIITHMFQFLLFGVTISSEFLALSSTYSWE